jgi:hypothetical protein
VAIASWLLDEGSAGADDAAAGSATTAPSTSVSLFVSGPLTPFQRDQKQDFATGAGHALLRSHVAQILCTQAATEDGTNYDALGGLFKHFVAAAIPRFEPTVRLAALSIVLDKKQRASVVRMKLQPLDGRSAAVGPAIDVDVPLAGEETPS